jgi:hypothetical protein
MCYVCRCSMCYGIDRVCVMCTCVVYRYVCVMFVDVVWVML